MGPAGSRPKGKEKEKPKIRNLRRYRIGGELWDLQPAAGQKEREGKAENQKFEAL